MDGAEFLRSVTAHPQLFPGRGPRDDRIYIVAHPFPSNPYERDVEVGWELEPQTILAHSWKTLEDVLLGRRRPEVMSHITRIVGYYSQLRGWNRSKLAELRDRHKGNYRVPGARAAHGSGGETPQSKRAHARIAQKRARRQEAVLA
jgi:hypothetical protein